MPKISVIMGVCNGRRYLAAAIASLKAQTFTDWELVLVENGATESARDIAEAECPPDKLVMECGPEPLGPGGALFRACELASGDYLAVMDQDDTARPRRLELQYDFMEKFPEIGLLGGVSDLIDGEGKVWGREPYLGTHEEIMPMLAYGHVLRHSMTMFRRELLSQVTYRRELQSAVDIDFFARAAEVTRLACLPVVLGEYRLHGDNVTKRKAVNVTCHGALARMLTRRRRTGMPEEFADWLAQFKQIEVAIEGDEGAANAACSKVFRREGYFDLAALYAWQAWRTGRNWRAPWLYISAVTRGLWQSREARRGLINGWLKVPGLRLLQARGVKEPMQF